MSIIRNLLYNGASSGALCSGILYNQTLLHNFILQHEPKFIIHCGSPENALDLAHFVKENQPCEILHIKNWHPSSHQWLQANGDAPNPHQAFLDKINELNLEDHLVSFDGASQTAYEVLNYRNFRFNMMISDNVGDHTDYIPLISLLQKNAVHIRYIGDKKISQVKEEAIFQTDIETSFTYAQGYLITGMDYLSLYETQLSPVEKTAEIADQIYQEQTQEFQYNDLPPRHNDITQPIIDNNQSTINNTNNEAAFDKNNISNQDDNTPSLQDIREKRREERRKAREERRMQRALEKDNRIDDTQEDIVTQVNDIEHNESSQADPSPSIYAIEDDGTSAIVAARKALREKRAARRQSRKDQSE